jgi:Response regulator containing CheY-like receiver, AAA-type ATPase, and DNA-binding domains
MNTNKLRILVVDDDEDDFLLVRDLLQSTAEMDHAATPERALAAMEGRPYDLMLFDYLLGAQTGLDLLKAVRQRGVQAPIIFLTGRGDEEVASMRSSRAPATTWSNPSSPNRPCRAQWSTPCAFIAIPGCCRKRRKNYAPVKRSSAR